MVLIRLALLLCEPHEAQAMWCGVRCHAAAGALPPSATVSWQVEYLPTTDDKMCPILPDEAQQRYFKKV